MHLCCRLADDVVMIAIAVYSRGERYPTAEYAVYRTNFPAGEPDNFATDEGSFGELWVRKFFPGSGCGVIVEDGRIRYTEPGLRGFVGRPITVSHTSGGDAVLVAWQEHLRDFCKGELKTYLGTLQGLRLTFGGAEAYTPADFEIAL